MPLVLNEEQNMLKDAAKGLLYQQHAYQSAAQVA